MNKDILWVEQYRPSTIDDLILPEEIKSTFREIISQDKIPNLILSGSAGVGRLLRLWYCVRPSTAIILLSMDLMKVD